MNGHENPPPKLPTPLHLLVTLLVIISSIEALVHFYLPLIIPDSQKSIQGIADASLLTFITAPFIWRLIAHPLRVAAMTEISRTNAVLTTVVEAVICFNEGGTIESLNPAAERMFGYRPQEIIGQHISTIIPSITDDSTISRISANQAQSSSKGSETSGCRNNGTFFPAEISISYLKVGAQIVLIAIIHDISKRKNAEEALKISEEKFSKAFHAAPDGIVISSKAEGSFIEANEAFFRILGYPRDEVIGHSSLELGLWVDPDQRRRIMERTEREGAVRNEEVQLRIQSGEIRTILWSSDSIALDAAECLIVTLRDITVQKDNERKLLKSKAELIVKHEQLSIIFSQVETVKKEWERTMDCIRDMVILLDWKGHVKRCNRAAAELVGVSYERIIGQDWQLLMQSIGAPSSCSIDGHCEFYDNKTDRWLSITYYPENENGEHDIAGSVITIHDTTGTKRAAMELEKAYTELKETHAQMLQQEKMASIGQLAAGVAHEINNPTGFIISNLGTLKKYFERLTEFIRAQSEIIRSHEGSEEEKIAPLRKQLKVDHIIDDIPNLITESLDGADRMKRIVRDMKSFSRMDETDCMLVNLTEYIESTINIVWNEIKYKATLTRDYSDLPAIKCHPQQLSQVFMNLLVNAAHAIETHGEITVSTWQANKDVFIAVADTGSGIPEEIRGHIFEPFFTTKEVGKGTGLGLSISYDIIKNHGGDISVDSAVGVGTTFTIRLPMNCRTQDAAMSP